MKRFCVLLTEFHTWELVKRGCSFIVERSWLPLWHVPAVSSSCLGPVPKPYLSICQGGGLGEQIKVPSLPSPLRDCPMVGPLSVCQWKNRWKNRLTLPSSELWDGLPCTRPPNSLLPFPPLNQKDWVTIKNSFTQQLSHKPPLPCLRSQHCLPLTPHPSQPGLPALVPYAGSLWHPGSPGPVKEGGKSLETQALSCIVMM